MNYRIVWNTLGKVLLAEALLLLLPMTAALVYRESALPFLIPDLLLLPAGAALSTVRLRRAVVDPDVPVRGIAVCPVRRYSPLC